MAAELNESEGKDCSDKEHDDDKEKRQQYSAIVRLLLRNSFQHIALGQTVLGIWPSTTAEPEHHPVKSDVERLPPFCTSSNAGHGNHEALSAPLPDEDGDDLDIYEYTPLSGYRSIRVVQIHEPTEPPGPTASSSKAPSKPSWQEVHCSLVEVSVDDLPSYWALSYTWGNPRYVVDSDAAFRSSRLP